MYDEKTIAKYIVESGDFDEMQVQKLLYLAQGTYMLSRGDKLIDATFEAWIHGPVLRHVWALIHYDSFSAKTEAIDLSMISEEDKIFLKFILDKYGHMSASELRKLTHDSAFGKARKGLEPDSASQRPIEDSDIRLAFEQATYKAFRTSLEKALVEDAELLARLA